MAGDNNHNCAMCGYLVPWATEDVCPECGASPEHQREHPGLGSAKAGRKLFIVACICGLLGAAIGVSNPEPTGFAVVALVAMVFLWGIAIGAYILGCMVLIGIIISCTPEPTHVPAAFRS